jgi:hypothetical protein
MTGAFGIELRKDGRKVMYIQLLEKQFERNKFLASI